MDIINKINDEDYAIILRPHLDKYFKWTGEVSVDVMTSERNSLEDEDAEGMMSFVSMVCASIPVMDSNPAFKKECDRASKIFLKNKDKCAIDKIEKVENNIIKVDFQSRDGKDK
jgi:hypothetical protein|tara:strand:- start:135 stop:476 length:342 start_codon:yes stop_codon:yes gene_type:complete